MNKFCIETVLLLLLRATFVEFYYKYQLWRMTRSLSVSLLLHLLLSPCGLFSFRKVETVGWADDDLCSRPSRCWLNFLFSVAVLGRCSSKQIMEQLGLVKYSCWTFLQAEQEEEDELQNIDCSFQFRRCGWIWERKVMEFINSWFSCTAGDWFIISLSRCVGADYFPCPVLVAEYKFYEKERDDRVPLVTGPINFQLKLMRIIPWFIWRGKFVLNVCPGQ